jgi:hypothetical protein
LIPKAVACEHQALPLAIEERERVHAFETSRQLERAEVLVTVHQDLRVAGAPKDVAPGHELRSQIAVIVNLTVEHDDDGGVLVEKRLVSARAQIDDRQAAHADPDVAFDQRAIVVRAAMADAGRHRLHRGRADRASIEADDANDAAHVRRPSRERPGTRRSSSWPCHPS